MKRFFYMMLAIMVCVPLAYSQEKQVEKTSRAAYRLDFMFYEMEDGKRTNLREYSMVLMEGSGGSVKTGSRMPLQGEKGPIYMDVGLSIHCRLVGRDERVGAEIDMEFNSLASPELSASSTPLLRNNNARVSTLLTPGKPQFLASIEDINSKKRGHIELKATKLE